MAARYKHNYAAFGKECLCAGFMVNEMRQRANRVMARARATAPVGTPGSPFYELYESAIAPGHYRDSFVASHGIRSDMDIGPRAYGRVENTSSYAGIVEFGYGRVPKHRVLGKALAAAL